MEGVVADTGTAVILRRVRSPVGEGGSLLRKKVFQLLQNTFLCAPVADQHRNVLGKVVICIGSVASGLRESEMVVLRLPRQWQTEYNPGNT